MRYQVKTYTDFENQKLVKAWHKIEQNNQIFPQLSIDWIKPWWEANSSKRELNIVVLLNENQEIFCIVPLCIEKYYGVKVLRNIPIHFGDFYSVLSPDLKKEIACNEIVKYFLSYKNWNVVHLFNINSSDPLYLELKKSSAFKGRFVVPILSPSFKNISFDGFLKTLSKNTRSNFKKKLNRLKKEGEITLKVITNGEEYLEYFEHTKAMYNARWQNDYISVLSDEYYQMRNKALIPCINKKSAVMYCLNLDNKPIGFRIGFITNKTFFDWKVSHDPSYDYYSPGFLLVGLIIEDIINKGFDEFNFMTGDYRYKRSWTNNDNITENFEFLSGKTLSIGTLYSYYRLFLREKLRFIFTTLKKRLM